MSKGQCIDCEDILESKHRHDFVKCKCGKSFLDGGDDYFRGGGSLGPVSDEEFCLAVDRDQALQKLIEEVVEDDIFNDDSFLDDDFEDYNLGYQAGTLDERDRILKLIKDRVSKAKEYADNGQVTAMQRPVSWDDLYAISEAIIYGIEKESKSD